VKLTSSGDAWVLMMCSERPDSGELWCTWYEIPLRALHGNTLKGATGKSAGGRTLVRRKWGPRELAAKRQ